MNFKDVGVKRNTDLVECGIDEFAVSKKASQSKKEEVEEIKDESIKEGKEEEIAEEKSE